MMRSVGLVLFVWLGCAVTLTAAPRLVSVEPAMVSPGAEIVTSGSDLAGVELLFLTAGSTDIEVEILKKTGEEIRFRLPTDVAHGQYRLMVQTGGDEPALLVQPVMCKVMGEAEIAELKAKLAQEERRIEDAAAPAAPSNP